MTTIVRLPLESAGAARALWATIAGQAHAWAAAQAIEMRDGIVLVPFVQLIEPARRAFAAAGGWMPRIETTQTLAASLGPPPAHEAGQIRFDAAVDALTAAHMLRAQRWGAAWARRDARGFAHAVSSVVATAHAMARAAAAVAPAARDAHWEQARALLQPVPGPGRQERLLARVALEWAALAPPPATDRLFALAPAAWIIVQGGGADPLCAALCVGAAASLWIDTDPTEPFANANAIDPPAHAVCEGFEDEAQAAAAQVLAHLRAGEQPVALIAQDRVLVRRVRALLERRHVTMLDETGWKLSTTRAAVPVAGLLQAARTDTSTDSLLDALKAIAGVAGSAELATRVDALEAICRDRQIRRAAGIGANLDEGPLRTWFDGVQAWLAPLAKAPRQGLAAWLETLAGALRESGAWPGLAADDAGRQVLAALRLEHPQSFAALSGTLGLDDVASWVRDVLEQETFRPAAPGGAAVVITPLARALLRPFAAIVLPGADDQHLGGDVAPQPLLSHAEAAALGISTIEDQRRAELLAFMHALAAPHVTLLRRRIDGTTPLAESPLVERLQAALRRAGRVPAAWADPRRRQAFDATPVARPSPHAPALLPERLSASAVEALRACPYRFFAVHMLRLRERDELDDEVDKRDYGNWLHAVLHRFHSERPADPGGAADDRACLDAIGRETRDALGLDAAEFLPFAASFADFVPRYVAWLREREAAGAHWQLGEHRVQLAPPAFGGARLDGIIDRIDSVRGKVGRTIELIDYKTGSYNDLRSKVGEPFEDTQLAVYAALMRASTDAPLSAMYLALDRRPDIKDVVHPNVEASAEALVDGLAHDLARLRVGHPMPALGEGSACDYCSARGLCRRDHWSADAP